MNKGFDLSLSYNFFGSSLNRYINIHDSAFKKEMNKWDKNLNIYIKAKQIDMDYLSGDKIADDWFPQIEADIFISHSHKDERLAKATAGWFLSNFHIRPFIDSCVWGYCSDLLNSFNQKYSNKYRIGRSMHIYDLNDCNHNSQHVNIMLLMALEKMMDNTETVFFLNTNNSINHFECNTTYSPWIYAELLCAKIIRKRRPSRLLHSDLGLMLYEDALLFKKKMKIEYGVDLEELEKIDHKNLKKWKDTYIKHKNEDKNKNPLDTLYEITEEEKQKNHGKSKSHVFS